MKITRLDLVNASNKTGIRIEVMEQWYNIIGLENGRRRIEGLYKIYKEIIETNLIEDGDFRAYIKYLEENFCVGDKIVEEVLSEA